MSSYCLSARPNNRCSKKSKKRQNCTTTHVSSLDTVEEQGGWLSPPFLLLLCQTVLLRAPLLLLLRLVLSTVINQKNVKHHAVKKKTRLKWLSYHGSFVLRLPLSSWLIKKWNTTAVKKNTPRQMRVTRYKKTKREAAWSCREVTASHLLTHASPRASAIDDSLIDGGWVLAMLR